jgi:hypothetical protein
MENKITNEDVEMCWQGRGIDYLAEILNGEYSIEEAREDISSLIGSEYDLRNNQIK